MSNKTSQQIVDECNELARNFFQASGWRGPDGFKFYRSTSSRHLSMWNLAVMAYAHIEGTDVDDCLTEMDEDEECNYESVGHEFEI